MSVLIKAQIVMSNRFQNPVKMDTNVYRTGKDVKMKKDVVVK